MEHVEAHVSVPTQRVRDADREHRRVCDLAEVVGEDVPPADELAQRPLPEQHRDYEQHEPRERPSDRVDDGICGVGEPTQRAEKGRHGARVATAEYRSQAVARQRRYNLPRPRAAMSRLLITLGIIIVAVGLLWPLLAKLGLGNLPGDIRIERDDFTLYIPLTSGLIVSAVVSLILWLLHK
jgi:hypothetical protein